MEHAAKKSKEEVDYGHGHRGRYCKDCEHFTPGERERAFGRCSLVRGLIGRLMWCRLFEPRTAKQGKS